MVHLKKHLKTNKVEWRDKEINCNRLSLSVAQRLCVTLHSLQGLVIQSPSTTTAAAAAAATTTTRSKSC